MNTFVSARATALCVALAAALGVSGCIGQTHHRGYLISESALEQVPVGSSREHVLIALGTPSTTADFGGEVFYYVSQTTNRPVRFMNDRVIDQRVLAVYLGPDGRVSRVANYGLQDGRVFDFVTRATPTGGSDVSFISQLLSNAANFGAAT